MERAMIVQDMLNAKGGMVISMVPTDTLAEAAEVMYRNKIGAVVIADDTACLCGLIAERDIVQAFAQHGAGVHAFSVADVMSRDVIVCHPQDQMHALMEIMTKSRVRHIPVVQDGSVCGIVSIGDAVKHKLLAQEQEMDEMRHYVHTVGA
jgi:CBS domain-containing protein